MPAAFPAVSEMPAEGGGYGDDVDEGWEARMAARAHGRANERIARREQSLERDRPGHVGHHLHRTPLGTECSCGSDFQDACYVGEGEDQAWWARQRCAACDRQGVLLEGAAP